MGVNTISATDYYYEISDTEKPVIEILNFTTDKKRKGIIEINEIIFVLEGKCEITCDAYPSFELKKDEAAFLPLGSHFHANFYEASQVIIIRLDPFQKVYGSYSIEELYEFYKKSVLPDEVGIINIKEILRHYLHNLYIYIQSGINNQAFYEIKIKELFLVLSGYYEVEELCNFFKPIMNNDFVFASLMLNNWTSVKSAKELAELSNYCDTAFNKKFKKVFGTTPYKWLNEKRSGKIFYELTHTNKPFKQIAEEFDFNSQQQFNDYCMRNFKQTPGNIRSNN